MFSYKVSCTAVVLGWLLASHPASAQTSINGVRISTDPPGPSFLVDGQHFGGPVDFFWPASSKHVVTSYNQDQPSGSARYVYRGWVSNLSNVASMDSPITASPGLRSITLLFEATYPLTIALPACSDLTQVCSPGGRVLINNVTFDRRGVLFLPTGSRVNARAFPNSGFVFTGWTTSGFAPVPNDFDITFTFTRDGQIAPQFQLATAVQTQVNVQTDPPFLQVLLDRTPIIPPAKLEWGWGSVHSVGVAALVQNYRGTPYVFESWSDGGAVNHDITVPNGGSPINLTARFVPASSAGFETSPRGFNLSIDGLAWPINSFNWVPGSVHTISAPQTQTDAAGRRFRFASWSNGKPATFEYTAPPAPGGERLTAVYEEVGRAVISSVPSGLSIEVDGADCATPCSLEKEAGATVTVAVPDVRSIDERSRLVFQGWGDSGETRRTITLDGTARNYTANYLAQYQLSVEATPSEGATFTVTPSSADGFYDEGSVVSVAAKVALGFKAAGWTGDVSGSTMAAAIAVDAPRRAVLLLDRVPAIGPQGVRNAAAPANSDDVAPGSLISIFGANLAGGRASGAAVPLPQTLGNVTVRVNDSFLPLVFVSPSQINAQLPAGLAEGNQRLIVRWEGKPESSTTVKVTRNAPGLFSTGPEEQAVGTFLSANGQAITAEQPARAGDIVSLLGTGLGAYTTPPPDGFVFDEYAGFVLVDRVTVVAGADQNLDSLYAGRSSAGAGVDAVRFQVPADLPEGQFLPVKLVVNGRVSNTVLLPVTH